MTGRRTLCIEGFGSDDSLHYVTFQSREVQKKLINLYSSPHMSSSVKLHIIAALDQTTRLKEGLDWLLGRHHVQVTSTAGIVPPSRPTASLTVSGLGGEAGVKKEPADEMSATSDKEDSEAGHLTGYQRILSVMATKQVCSLTYKVLTTSQPAYLHNLISLQTETEKNCPS